MAITYTDNGGGAANGSDKEFTYTFPVIQTEDVKVALNGVTQATTKYTVDNVSNPTKITFNTTNPTSGLQVTSGTNQGAPLAGVRVRVYRETTVGKTNGDESPKAVFAAGSSIRAIDLNANQEQSLMAIHELQDRPIETEDIQNDAITNVKIADDQIDSEHYVAGSIDLEHMSANSVDSDQYVDGSIDHIHLSNDCVDGDNIQDDSINSEHYVDRSIDTQHIGGSQVTTNELANNSVTTIKIADGNVTTAKLEANIIDGTKLADNAVNSEHYTDGSIDHVHLANDIIDGDNIQDDVINSEHIAAGALDNEHYADGSITSDKLNAATVITSSEQGSATTNDTSFLTSAAADARFFNISSGDTIKDGQSFPDNDTTIATTAAINDRIIDIVNDVGGFDIIESEQHFPNTNPQGQAGSAAVLSIKAATGNLVPSGTTLTISNGNLANNANITITGVTSTIPTGFGFIVESTSTLHTYTFHRLVPNATEVTTVAGISSNVTTVAGVASNVTTVAGISSNVTAVAGNATNINSVASIASNINAVAADASDIGIVAADGTDIGLVAGSITNVNNVGGSIANVNTVASNLSGVNSFADRYRVDSSAPGTNNDAGDLYFDTSSNELRVYNGSAWQGGVTATGNLAGTGANTFTGNQIIQNALPSIDLIDSDNNSDFKIQNANGTFLIYDTTNSASRFTIASDGTVDVNANIDANQGIDVTGNITVTGNVDGRDIAADGASLDNIEAGNIGTDVTNGNVKLSPNGTGVVEVRGAGGADGTLQLNCSAQSHGIKLKSPPHSAAQSYTLTFPSSIVNNGFLKTDSSGNLSFAAVNTELVNDTSPQLGGGLQSNGNNITFGDSSGTSDDRLVFGAGSDLQIYHDGNGSFIKDVGTGSLAISGSVVNIISSDSSEYMIKTVENGEVELYYNGVKKLYTYVDGAKVEGDFVFKKADGTTKASWSGVENRIKVNDGTKFIAGDGNDLQIYHSGSHSFIQEEGTGSLYIDSNQLYLRNADTDNVLLYTTSGGQVRILHNGNEKFRTESFGATLTGNLDVTNGDVKLQTDSNKITFGAGSDLQIYHNGTDSYINNTTGNLNIYGDVIQLRSSNDEYYLKGTANGAVELYHDNSKKFDTTSTGVEIHGNLQMDDNGVAYFGTSGDLEIFHDGSNSYIRDQGVGDLIIRGSTIRLRSTTNEEMLTGIANGTVRLYYDNAEKIATTSTGVEVQGRYAFNSNNYITCNTTANTMEFVAGGQQVGEFNSTAFTFLDNRECRFGTGNDLKIYHDGSNSYIYESGTGNLQITSGSSVHIKKDDGAGNTAKIAEFNVDGDVELYHTGSKKFETTSTGIDVTGAITVNGSALGSGGLISTDSDSGYLTSGDQSLSSSYSEIMELQITPSSSSNKVAIFSTMVLQTNGSHTWGGPAANHKVTRTVGGTTTTLINQNILYQRDNVYAAKYLMAPSSIDYMDSPNTTSQVTYKIYARYSDTATSGSVKSYNSIAMEVAV